MNKKPRQKREGTLFWVKSGLRESFTVFDSFHSPRKKRDVNVKKTLSQKITQNFPSDQTPYWFIHQVQTHSFYFFFFVQFHRDLVTFHLRAVFHSLHPVVKPLHSSLHET